MLRPAGLCVGFESRASGTADRTSKFLFAISIMNGKRDGIGRGKKSVRNGWGAGPGAGGMSKRGGSGNERLSRTRRGRICKSDSGEVADVCEGLYEA